MGKTSKYIYLIIVFCFLSCIDFYFSNLIVNKLLIGASYSTPWFKLTYVENTGAAFSIMQNSFVLLLILAVLSIVLLLYLLVKNISIIKVKVLFFGAMLLAGIFGNLYERIFFGHVRDFFDLTFINFPVFNISDIFINIGVLGIIILILCSMKDKE